MKSQARIVACRLLLHRPCSIGTGEATGRGGGSKAATEPTPGRTTRTAAAEADPGIRHATALEALDVEGTDRTKVAVGERVDFWVPGAKTGTWSASERSDGSVEHDPEEQRFVWYAPTRPGEYDVTISYTPEATTTATDAQSAAKRMTMKVISPKTIAFEVTDSHATLGAGSGMVLHPVIGPSTVAFEHLKWREHPTRSTEAKGATGYFAKYLQLGGNLRHEPNAEWHFMDNGLHDTASVGGLPKIEDSYCGGGEFYWEIPNMYSMDDTGEGHEFAKVKQHFKMEADGTVTVEKGGAKSEARRPQAEPSVKGSTDAAREEFLGGLAKEGLEALTHKLRTAPDTETRTVIMEVIAKRDADIVLWLKCKSTFRWFGADQIKAISIGRAAIATDDDLTLNTNEEKRFEAKFADAFDLTNLTGGRAIPAPKVSFVANGNPIDTLMDSPFQTSTAYRPSATAPDNYLVWYELHDAEPKVE